MKKNIVQFKGVLAEMAEDNKLEINVPIASGIDLAELTKGDENPMFVVVEVLNESVSKNGRRYTPKVIHELARQINEKRPDGYEGHLTQEERSHKRPQPKTIWVGAVVKEVNGVARLYAKGYIMPYASDLKTYLNSAKAAVKKVAVSIYGLAEQAWNAALGAYDVSNVELESIDWARPGSEGVPTTGYLAIAAEMNQSELMTREELIGSLTKSELEAHGVQIIQEIKEEAKQEVVSEVKKEETGQLRVIREMMSVDTQANVVTYIAEMTQELAGLRQFKAETLVRDTLRDNIPVKQARETVERIVLSEMKEQTPTEASRVLSEVLQRDTTKAIIKEMSELKDLLPTVNNRNKTSEESRKYTKVENSN